MRPALSSPAIPSPLLALSLRSSVANPANSSTPPACAQRCIAAVLQSSTCLPSDSDCICADVGVNQNISSCVAANCTVIEGLNTQRLSSESCGLAIRDQGSLVTTVAIVGGALATISVLFRLYTRLARQEGRMMMDDVIVVTTLLLVIPFTGVLVAAVYNGLGQDIWMLMPEQITDFLKVFYVAEILYTFTIFFAKTNFLFFYLRIFPDPKFCRLTWGLIGFCLAASSSFGLATIFQCSPRSYKWTRWDGQHEGECLNINLQSWINAGINILLDVVILGLPITRVVRLNIHWKERMVAALMFGMGFFITIVSVIRLKSIVVYQTTSNPTWDLVGISCWSLVELDVLIICACMPALRQLVRQTPPGTLLSTRSTTDITQTPKLRVCDSPSKCLDRDKVVAKPNGADDDVIQLMEFKEIENRREYESTRNAGSAHGLQVTNETKCSASA